MIPRELTVEDLERWTDFGATWRLVDSSEDRVVLDMCECTGEVSERRESSNPAVLAYVQARLPAAG